PINSDGQQESSSVSSQFVTSMLNPISDVDKQTRLLRPSLPFWASASESAFAEEPVQTTSQIEKPSHPVFEIAVQGSTQTWISELTTQADSRSSFNELLVTPLDFSNFIMNQLRVDTLTPELLAGPTYKLMKGSYYENIKWIKDLMPRTMWIQEPINYDKHALWGVSYCGRKRQQFYGFVVNRESSLDVYSKRRIIAIYKFKEGDFKRLRLQGIKDMLLLLAQGKLSNLTVEERFAFNVSLRMFTRSIVIQRRVEDLQLGVESYQKRLNLTKPDTYRSDLKQREAYTTNSNPRGFIYQNKDKKNRLMRTDELHKFSDGTLNDVRTALDDCLKGIRMQYLPQTIWRKGDKDRAAAMIQAIDKMLKTRRIMRSLDKFVGGRLCEEDIIAFNNVVALLEHPNEVYRPMLSFHSNCCINKDLTLQPFTMCVEYLKEFWYTTEVEEDTKTITFLLSWWDKPMSFTQEEFICSISLPICKDDVPLPPKETSLIPSSGEVNADNTVDKSLSRACVQPVTQPKVPTDLKAKKKRIPPSSKPKSPYKVRVILPKKQVTETQHAKITVATADATKSLVASELAKEQVNQPSSVEAKIVTVLDQKFKETVQDSRFVAMEDVTFEQIMDKFDSKTQGAQKKDVIDITLKDGEERDSSKSLSGLRSMPDDDLASMTEKQPKSPAEEKDAQDPDQTKGEQESGATTVAIVQGEQPSAQVVPNVGQAPSVNEEKALFLYTLEEKISKEDTLGKKETDDEPPAKKLKLLIPSSSIPSPTPLKSIMPKPVKVTEAIKMTMDQFTKHLSKTTSSIFSPTLLGEPTPPKEPKPLIDSAKGKEVAIIEEKVNKLVHIKKKERLANLKVKKERSEQELRKMFNQATLKAQAHKWTKHKVKKVKMMEEEKEFYLATTAQLIRLQRSIQRGTLEADEMFRKLKLTIEARDDVVQTRDLVKDNFDGLVNIDIDQDSEHMVAASKVLMLKPDNGATFLKTQVVDGVITMMSITTAEEKTQRRLEVKARSNLMMGIPNKHQLNFNSIKDAKQLLKLLKRDLMLDQTFDRLKNLVSQLELLGEKLSQEDVNQKECIALRNQDNKHKESKRRSVPVETPTSTFDSKVSNDSTCSKTCLETVKLLKSHNDKLLKDLKKSELMVLAYKTGLKSVEERLEFFKKNEFIYLEDIKVLKAEIQMKEIAITELRRKLEIAQKEKDGIQLTIYKLGNASKGLNKLIECQIVDNCKKGLGYENYNAVSPPYTGNFMPSKPDLSFTSFDEFANKPAGENSNAKSSEKETKTVRKNNDALIIEE
nr:hypothetical protein [Tanacetum cinerariifolium]